MDSTTTIQQMREQTLFEERRLLAEADSILFPSGLPVGLTRVETMAAIDKAIQRAKTSKHQTEKLERLAERVLMAHIIADSLKKES